MNRQERRKSEKQFDRQIRRSILVIKEELSFLNAAGNPKYKLVVESDFAYKTKRFLSRLNFWS